MRVTDQDLKSLADAVEAGGVANDAVASAVNAAIAPESLDAADFASTDALVAVVDRLLPGWSITIDGVASLSDGHWVCVLRQSAARDNDPYLGIGKAAALPQAMLAGLLKVLSNTRRTG